MKKIESFEVDHTLLKRGVYVSRKDTLQQDTLTTFDIRMKKPNCEPVMNTAELHTLEHLGATFLRNHPLYQAKIIYFGPMGCRTGFYAIFKGDMESEDILGLVKELFCFMKDYDGEIFGGDAYSCGNYLDLNLMAAKYEAKKFYEEVLLFMDGSRLHYPQ
ncbi:MAG: S-ribosylhomocysteine lyase [Breznakia sp.]